METNTRPWRKSDEGKKFVAFSGTEVEVQKVVEVVTTRATLRRADGTTYEADVCLHEVAKQLGK